MKPGNWYIIRLYRQNKLLFLFVLLFICFQGYFNIKRIHSFPWYIWDMYSRAQPLPDTLTQTEFYTDGVRLDITSIPIWEEATITHTYRMYNWQKMNGFNDPIEEAIRVRTQYFPERFQAYVSYKIMNHEFEAANYPGWLKEYLEARLSRKIKTLEIKEVQYHYENGKFQPGNSWTVLKTED